MFNIHTLQILSDSCTYAGFIAVGYYSAQYHKQLCTIQAFQQFGALYSTATIFGMSWI